MSVMQFQDVSLFNLRRPSHQKLGLKTSLKIKLLKRIELQKLGEIIKPENMFPIRSTTKTIA